MVLRARPCASRKADQMLWLRRDEENRLIRRISGCQQRRTNRPLKLGNWHAPHCTLVTIFAPEIRIVDVNVVVVVADTRPEVAAVEIVLIVRDHAVAQQGNDWTSRFQ